MWNNTNTYYGDGDDFGIYTYNNRDMILHAGSGNVFLNAAKVGIGTHAPQAKLHIPNGDIIVGGMEGITNTLNSSLFIKSRADNSSTYPLYVGKYNSGSDLFWVRGEGDAYLHGNVGIGTILASNPNNYKLAVKGKIGAQEVQVENTSATWADYVFEKSYRLKPLSEVEAFINANKHLPEVPSKNEVEENGHKLGEMDVILLKKVEELTLYLIEANKQIEKLNKELQVLKGKSIE